jgi:ectoine hydroxylase-related dioxygenase (phytanoyl-CoA dioxygenase family)
VAHVYAPYELLEQMFILRFHLDDCDESNGALRVLPGTHLFGRLSSQRIKALAQTVLPITCSLSAGDALLMRPLLLHSSSRSRKVGHRRVLHIEYSTFDLPFPLQWQERLSRNHAVARHEFH